MRLRVALLLGNAAVTLISTSCRQNHVPILGNVQGPTSCLPDTAYPFTVIAEDVDGDLLCVRFCWGDGDTSTWSEPRDPGDTTFEVLHSWSSPGTYGVSAQARDLWHAHSAWSVPLNVTCSRANTAPFFTSPIMGPLAAEQDSLCTFAVGVNDSDGDLVAIRFAWNDGDTSQWSPYALPGVDSLWMSHVWDSSGTFSITAQARDSWGAASVWSDSHPVTVASAYPWRIADTFEVSGSNDNFAVLPDGELLYATDIGQGTVFVVRTDDHALVDRIDIGEQSAWTVWRWVIAPEGCAFAYVIGYNDFQLAALRTSDNTVVEVMSDIYPVAMAASADGKLLYVPAVLQTDKTGIVVYSTADNQPTDTLNVSWNRSDVARAKAVVRPDGRVLYITANGVLRAIDLENRIVSESLNMDWPGQMVVTPDGSRLYVLEANGVVAVVNTDDCSIAARVSTGITDAECLAVLPGGDYVYVGGEGGALAIIRTCANAVVRRTSLHHDICAMQNDPSGSALYAVGEWFTVLER